MATDLFVNDEEVGPGKVVDRAPLIQARRTGPLVCCQLGLSLSVLPVALQGIAVSLLWHASYDRDPAHAWLRQTVVRLVAEL